MLTTETNVSLSPQPGLLSPSAEPRAELSSPLWLTADEVIAQTNRRLGRPVMTPALLQLGVDKGAFWSGPDGWVNEGNGLFHYETVGFLVWTHNSKRAIFERVVTFDQWSDLFAYRVSRGPRGWWD